MTFESIPEWLSSLEDEDYTFIKNFILVSGSLKEMATLYNVTYPTIRLRLDKLIQKIQLSQSNTDDKFILLIKNLAINEKLDFNTTKLLITEYRKLNKRR